MGTKIKAWQINDGKLDPINTDLKSEGRTEPYDLEPWIASNSEILGADIVLIGRQVSTETGPIDLLGIDRSGNAVIVELKRDHLPREALAQAIDYASSVSGWTVDRLGDVCTEYKKRPLEDVFQGAFPDVDQESIVLNSAQRIILVGFSMDSSLERMIKWLSDSYDVNINASVLSFLKTSSGEELLAKTSIISEEMEFEKQRKRKKFEIPMSIEPGNYELVQLKGLLISYLSRSEVTIERMRDIFLPACLKNKVVARAQLKKEFIDYDPNYDESKVGYYLTIISSQLGMAKNDFLRQVIAYETPRRDWEKDNFSIRDQYRGLVSEILDELKKKQKVQ